VALPVVVNGDAPDSESKLDGAEAALAVDCMDACKVDAEAGDFPATPKHELS